MFFLRLFSLGFFFPALAGLFRRFYFKLKLRGHVVVQFDRDFVFYYSFSIPLLI